ncbi:Holliday junction resolvase RuvX [Agitococcus lubricus]|uniref:Putative pre-16S rRNA nuclease n=1 Tax=Agitococcus lubricus TaxID=1077255 RepID=A0A2T5J314_9GAMM|nr:Holliday junction resolvase RuvX [Agitococcus lubricus]PTQ91011.1 putative Holliday junction resolvase [Agitococcus lubricus]
MLDSVQTVLGFDFGLKRIGVATGQRITASAAPLAALAARDGIPDWSLLARLVNEWQPDLLLVGLPLNMDDSESELSQLARKFARRLHGRLQKPVLMVDERLTSRMARELLSDIGQRRKGKLPSLDSTAAVLMLEAWLAQPDMGQPA